MARSQDIAAAVALKQLGYKVGSATDRCAGHRHVLPGTPAAKAGLEPTDVIVSVDGHPVRTTLTSASSIARHKPGEVVGVGPRAEGPRRAGAQHGRRAAERGRPVVGVLVEPGLAGQAAVPGQDRRRVDRRPVRRARRSRSTMQKLGKDVTAATRSRRPERSTGRCGRPDRRRRAEDLRCPPGGR